MEELNNIQEFNTGMSHEQNKYGGIPISYDQQGNMNTVEEGEVKIGDFVFSDRIKANKDTLKENDIPTRFAKGTFAEIAEKYLKEAKRRPNDSIAQETLYDMAERLATAQEQQKAEEEFNNMSPEEKIALMEQLNQANTDQMQQQQPSPEEMAMQEQMMAQNGYNDPNMQGQPSPEEIAMMQQQGMPMAYGGMLRPANRIRRFGGGGYTSEKWNPLDYDNYKEGIFSVVREEDGNKRGNIFDYNTGYIYDGYGNIVDTIQRQELPNIPRREKGHWDMFSFVPELTDPEIYNKYLNGEITLEELEELENKEKNNNKEILDNGTDLENGSEYSDDTDNEESNTNSENDSSDNENDNQSNDDIKLEDFDADTLNQKIIISHPSNADISNDNKNTEDTSNISEEQSNSKEESKTEQNENSNANSNNEKSKEEQSNNNVNSSNETKVNQEGNTAVTVGNTDNPVSSITKNNDNTYTVADSSGNKIIVSSDEAKKFAKETHDEADENNKLNREFAEFESNPLGKYKNIGAIADFINMRRAMKPINDKFVSSAETIANSANKYANPYRPVLQDYRPTNDILLAENNNRANLMAYLNAANNSNSPAGLQAVYGANRMNIANAENISKMIDDNYKYRNNITAMNNDALSKYGSLSNSYDQLNASIDSNRIQNNINNQKWRQGLYTSRDKDLTSVIAQAGKNASNMTEDANNKNAALSYLTKAGGYSFYNDGTTYWLKDENGNKINANGLFSNKKKQ